MDSKMIRYFELKEKALRAERNFIDAALKQLTDVEEKFFNSFEHPLLENLKNLYRYFKNI